MTGEELILYKTFHSTFFWKMGMKIVAQTKNVQQLLRISLFLHQRGTRLTLWC